MFNLDELLKSYEKANNALNLEHQIVGMKFIFTKEEFEEDSSEHIKNKLTYCAMVLKASSGMCIKANFDNFACFGGARALGVVDIDEFYTSGRFFEMCGLYQDLATSAEISRNMSICTHKVTGVTIKPLDQFRTKPDVVLFIVNPRNAMRIIQGYSHYYGTKMDYKLIGNQAICSEATARPYLTNDINITVLCKGPRSNGYQDHEMAVGMVFNKFKTVVDGICMTLTPVENNIQKDALMDKFSETEIDDVRIIKNRNYGSFFYGRDSKYFEEKRGNREEIEGLFPDIWREED